MHMRARLGLTAFVACVACQAQTPSAPDQEAFAAFMQRNWGPLTGIDASPIALAAVHRARRTALGAAHPGQLLIIPTGHIKYRINDTPFAYRPGNAFYYLTGSTEPDSVLALVPWTGAERKAGATHEAILFAAPTFDPNDARFYKDTRDGVLWVGPRLGLQASLERFAVDRALPLKALSGFLEDARGLWGPKVALLRGIDAEVDRAIPAAADDAALARTLAQLRLIKDAHELAALRRACEATRAGFTQALRAMRDSHSEHALDVAFTHVAHGLGNGVGYLPIVAAGPHATILHWRHNDGLMAPGQLVLMDAGVEDKALYTSDITRTFPVSGHFSAPQRRVYAIVDAAQGAALAAIRPGVAWSDIGKVATAALKAGLVDLQVLKDANTAVPLHQRYTLHGVSHMLGLDVHDCGETGKALLGDGALRAGMVFTVEPGLYFQPNDLTVPEALRGLGVRIEDDVVVTATGYERLCEMPNDVDAVEAWVKAAWVADDSTKAAPDSATETK